MMNEGKHAENKDCPGRDFSIVALADKYLDSWRHFLRRNGHEAKMSPKILYCPFCGIPLAIGTPAAPMLDARPFRMSPTATTLFRAFYRTLLRYDTLAGSGKKEDEKKIKDAWDTTLKAGFHVATQIGHELGAAPERLTEK